MKKPVILALVGPTGSGKTKTAIRLAQQLDGEIISMDSMQIYRHMDIGTAKPTPDERAQAVHHMIDIVNPDEIYTVSAYREEAFRIIEDILARRKTPILAGGTGLYLNAISYEMSLGENGADKSIRNELNGLAEEADGPRRLHDMLCKVDPESAARLHQNDIRRVIRALEVYRTTGKPMSETGAEEKQEGPYHVKVYGLSYPREVMYARINARVDAMIAEGLVDEVRMLLERGVEPRREGGSMQAIGYKEIVSALRGEITMDQAIALIKQSSRRYAKRQWTWFRHDERVNWFDFANYRSQDELFDALLARILADIRAYNES